jgi:adenosylcobinamide-phosphate synthase
VSLAAASAIALAAATDRAFGEPPTRLHPVAWLGRLVGGLDARLPDTRLVGVGIAVGIPTGFGLALAGLVFAGTKSMHAAVGSGEHLTATILATGALFVCTSHRMLLRVTTDVIALSESDLDSARWELRALAGRDASELSPAHVRSAAVESAAENLADGLIAPLIGFALGALVAVGGGLSTAEGLAVAAGVAGWVKGVNTLDSMLGYRHRIAGWAPARLDDAVMWLPARVAAGLLLAAGRLTRKQREGRHGLTPRGRPSVGQTAGIPDSPNAGWPMASIAALLGCRLEKPGAYALYPDRPLPTVTVARAGVQVVSRAGWLGIGAASVAVAGIGRALPRLEGFEVILT